MIIIDGRQTELTITNFANLEELLVSISEMEVMDKRVVTDVFVNEVQFSELYPHQAEDIESDELESVEIRSVPTNEMALAITEELNKVVQIMKLSSLQIAQSFRNLENEQGISLLLDTINVVRDFMSMIGALRTEFVEDIDVNFVNNVEALSGLLIEINEALEAKDWYLVSDLFEFEFIPVCDNWVGILANIHASISKQIK